jgi:hypothetical protein
MKNTDCKALFHGISPDGIPETGQQTIIVSLHQPVDRRENPGDGAREFVDVRARRGGEYRFRSLALNIAVITRRASKHYSVKFW